MSDELTSPHREEGNDFGDRVFRVVTAVALLFGAGSGGHSLYTSGDYATHTDLAIRDERINNIAERLGEVRRDVERIDETHPPPELIKRIDDHETRIRSVERRE